MTRPSKRRKVKNPLQKVSRRARKGAKGVKMAPSMANVHPLVAKGWDHEATLEENYERLGLVASVNGFAGGVGRKVREKEQVESEEEEEGGMDIAEGTARDDNGEDEDEDDDSESSNQADPHRLHEHFTARELQELGSTVSSALSIGVKVGKRNVARPKTQSREGADGGGGATTSGVQGKGKEPTVADELQRVAHQLSSNRPARTLSAQERRALQELVRKHGSDYDAMARDKKMNPFLYTAGQLRRKCEVLGGRRK